MADYESEFLDSFQEEILVGEEEIHEIQAEYRKKKLIESLIGPVISTIFHVILIIILAIFITDKYKESIPEVVVQIAEIEEVKIEEPPPIEEPIVEPLEVEKDVTNPVLTTVAIEDVETDEAALEDSNDEAPSTEDDSTAEAVSDVTVSPSAFTSQNVFGGRSAAGRAGAVAKFGGKKVGQDSLLKALWWLSKVQNPDGSWGNKYQSAYTGLALLTFLAYGETHVSKAFGVTVRKAMEWLAADNHKKNVGNGYANAIKAYALAEAYAMTGVSLLEDSMNVTIRKIIDGQQAGGSYNYQFADNGREDLSLAGWNYQALKAAYGAGCEEAGLKNAIYKSIAWLKDRGNSRNDGKGFPYAVNNGQGQSSGKHTMRAVGVLCLQLFGEGKTPEIKDELDLISTLDTNKVNWAQPPMESLYGWYYATQAMFQEGGNSWKNWNRKFQKELTANQNPEGFWEYPGVYHGGKGDVTTERVYATTLCALMLTVYYRYLPSTKGAIGNQGVKADKKAGEIEDEEGLNLID
ncbi:MAG: hypothetical protein NE330_14005 [Lentisphaeraceae bacterium]|nr:hypothetical protein [Lentisphaeraceae bacterium]